MSEKSKVINSSLLCVWCLSLFTNIVWAAVSPTERTKIETAVPKKPTVVPKKPRKLLVFNLDIWDGKIRKGHDSTPHGNLALELMGRKTGAYETVFSDDISMFKSENLKQYDAICFNNTCGILFEDPELKKSLLEFVYGGKGLIGFHSAAATFVQWPVYDQWPEFGEMLGGYEDGGHPWKADETVTIRVDDPGHPVNRAFNREGFEINDQVYQFRKPYSRDRVRVLISVDPEKTDMSPSRRFLPERRKDKDFPVSWIRNYGRGRVFYTSFGHNPHIFWNKPLLEHFLDGIQFALGDMPAPTTPSSRANRAIRNRETLGWRLGIETYSFKKFTFFEAVDKAASLGVRYIESGAMRVSKDIPRKLDYRLTGDEIAVVRAKLLSADIQMAGYYMHNIPADEQVVRQLFEFCRKLGVETIIGEPEPDAIDVIERFCDEYDINLAIHNHTKDISPVYWDPDNLLKVCRGRSKRIGVCPDIGYWIRAGFDPVDTLRKMKDRIITFHIHDVHEFSSKGHDVPWGTGVAKLDQFIKEAYELEINPTLWAIEYAHDFADNTSQIAQSIEYFDKTLGPIVYYERAYVSRTKGMGRRMGITDEQRSRIVQAIPDIAPATPKKPRKLLIFDLNIGYGGHPSIPYASFAVKLMGQKTGAYETVVSSNPAVFETDSLKQFDAVFFNNTVGNLFENAQLRQSLLDFVYSGGGFLGNHATSVAFIKLPGSIETWPEFAKMLGTRGASHRESDETITIKLDDPEHPLNAAFEGEGFVFTDEFFRFHKVYSRDNLRVLFSIDVDKTDMNQGRCYGNCFRDDNDYALAWVHRYGAGRVYYTTIGHNPYVFWDKNFLQHFLAAIQFALGDLEVGTTASNKLTPAVRAQEKLNWQLGVQAWSFNRFTFYEAIDKAAELGLRYIEAYIFGPKAGQRLSKEKPDVLFTYEMPPELRREVKQKLNDAGVRLVNCYIGALPKDQAQCRKIFEFAKDMGIETFVSEPPEDVLDTIEKLCDEYEINLAIHNHPEPSRYWNPNTVLKVCRGRSKRIGACADTGHWMRSGINPVEALKKLEGRIISLHFKDLNQFGNEDAHDVPWGTGKANVREMLAELDRQEFKGVFSIEYEYNWENSMPDIARCAEFFNSIVFELAKSTK